MRDAMYCDVSVMPCDLLCKIGEVADRTLPFAFGAVLWLIARAAAPLDLAERRFAARAAVITGTGWIVVPLVGRIFPDLRQFFAWTGFAIAAALVSWFVGTLG